MAFVSGWIRAPKGGKVSGGHEQAEPVPLDTVVRLEEDERRDAAVDTPCDRLRRVFLDELRERVWHVLTPVEPQREDAHAFRRLRLVRRPRRAVLGTQHRALPAWLLACHQLMEHTPCGADGARALHEGEQLARIAHSLQLVGDPLDVAPTP